MLPIEIPETAWDHQRKILNNYYDRRDFAYFLEQGTGKTFLTIQQMRAWYTKHRGYMRTLILCPFIVIENWRDEIEKFSKCGDAVQLLMGPGKKRIQDLQNPGKHIFVTNFEALDIPGLFWEKVERKVKRLDKMTGKRREMTETTQKFIDRGFQILIVDESHRLKDPSGKRSKLAAKIADKTVYRRILTGTPILNGEQDIWSQYRILDGGETFGTNFYAFRNTYFVDENAGMPSQRHFPKWTVRPEMAGKINQLIYNKAARVEKSECLDLPPLIETQITAHLDTKQANHYNEMKQELITYLGQEACTASIALTKALRLQQIVSGYLPIDGQEPVIFQGCQRLKVLEELLQDTQGKVIVWASFKPNYHMIAKIFEKLGLRYGFLTGEQSQKEKMAAVDEFRKDPDLKGLIANPGAGGTGVNLVEAATSIWYSRSFKLGDRLQALARNHRGGSEIHEKILSYDIVAPGTIDELGLAALRGKQDVADALLAWKDKL